jgi:hypothetical protein
MNELTNKFIENLNLLNQQVDYPIIYNNIIQNITDNNQILHYSSSSPIQNNLFKIQENSATNVTSEITVPISVLKNNSSMQSIVHYLKTKNYTFKKISEILNRDQRTIWSIYHKGKPLHDSNVTTDYLIPITIFQNRRLSVLENIVFYLKLEYTLEFTEIATLLGKNYRTIWTIYQRINAKNEQ